MTVADLPFPGAPALLPDTREPRFALGDDEPLAVGMQRLVVEQVDDGLDLIRNGPDLDTTVHELRKALKRVRAVLRLMRGELGRFRYRQENIVLRDTARTWSAVRDAAVMAAVARDLVDGGEGSDNLVGRRLVVMLEERHLDASQALTADRSLRMDTVTTLLCFRARVSRFPVVGDGAFPDRFASIRPGMLRIARRAAAGMEEAQVLPTAHRLHEWRKDVKYLRHHIEVLEPMWPDLLAAVAQRLTELGDVLGDEHDRAQLGRLIATDHTLVPDERSRRRLLGAIEGRRATLQTEAFALSASILSPSPDALVDRVEAAWGYRRR
ncbi:MAG: CHAD domain-containing protein [Actinomycetota bacterium]|nr:CHAD domain-containing protein [Actinomycetota bacterium]